MGFKEIEKFKEALLAKQVWQMINNPDFLCFKVFKAFFSQIAPSLKPRSSPQAPMLGKVS